MGTDEQQVQLVFEGGHADGKTGFVVESAAAPGATVNFGPKYVGTGPKTAQYRLTERRRLIGGIDHVVAELVHEEW